MFRDEFKESYTTIPFAIYRENSPSGNLDLISHRHKEIELISMTEGEATFYIDSTPYKTEKGDIIIIPPYSIHRAHGETEKNISYNCICFNIELLWDEKMKNGFTQNALTVKSIIKKDDPYAKKLQECIEDGCKACEDKNSGWEMEAIGNMSLIFGILKKNGYFISSVPSSPKKDFSEIVMKYISENYCSNITSGLTAKELFMNNSYFCRLFKTTFGCCFSDYILAYRLTRAKFNLINTTMSITDIAFANGFNNCSYFCKAFKARFGEPPLSYRKNHR